MNANEQAHQRALFRCAGREALGGALSREFVLEVVEDHRGLDERTPVGVEQCRHLSQRVDPPELLRLQVVVFDHGGLHSALGQPLLAQP